MKYSIMFTACAEENIFTCSSSQINTFNYNFFSILLKSNAISQVTEHIRCFTNHEINAMKWTMNIVIRSALHINMTQ